MSKKTFCTISKDHGIKYFSKCHKTIVISWEMSKTWYYAKMPW